MATALWLMGGPRATVTRLILVSALRTLDILGLRYCSSSICREQFTLLSDSVASRITTIRFLSRSTSSLCCSTNVRLFSIAIWLRSNSGSIIEAVCSKRCPVSLSQIKEVPQVSITDDAFLGYSHLYLA